MKKVNNDRKSEHGGAGVKFLLAFVVIILLANAGYNFVPIAYQGATFKQDMDTAVVQGNVVPMARASPIEAVRFKLSQAARANQIPENALVEVRQNGKNVIGRVRYAKYVELLPFGMFQYTYTFDHTASPNGYLEKD